MQKLRKITKLKSTNVDPDVGSMLENIIDGKEILKLRKGIKVFSQGADGDAIYFIQSGKVRVTIAPDESTEAVLAILGPGDFFGEGCMVGQSVRICTATTTESSTVFEIQKQAMLQALNAKPELSEKFIASLIVRNIDVEEDICNQLFNPVEKRLAHVLLKLSRYGGLRSNAELSQLSHETLPELVGTTSSQIFAFLNKFRRLGLIYDDGNGGLRVRGDMLRDMVLPV